MTHHPETEFHDRSADHLFLDYGRDLAAHLDTVLDIEAGLREVLVQVRHDAAVDRLGWVLDVEAGLRALLPPVSVSSPADTRAAEGRRNVSRLAWPVGATDRLSLRTHPYVVAAYRALTRDIAVAQDHLTRDHAHDLDLDLVHALARDLDQALRLSVGTERVRNDVLRRGLERVCSLNVALTLDLERTTGRHCERNHPHALARDLDRVRAMLRVFDRVRVHGRRERASLGLLIDRAHSRIRDLELVLERVGTHDRVLTSTIVNIRVNEVGRAIGMVLGREAPVLDVDTVHAFINDFTTADLRSIDLNDIDLAGVRWSEAGTRWPPAVDVEELKSRSDETPVHSGIWVVRSGTATVRGFAVDLG